MKILVILFSSILLCISVFAQAPIQRQQWTTNISGGNILGTSNLKTAAGGIFTTGDGEQIMNGLSVSNMITTRRSFYNVKDYGAVGNGTTDDTAALQSVAVLINAAKGGEVYFPAGSYLCRLANNQSVFNLDNLTNFVASGPGELVTDDYGIATWNPVTGIYTNGVTVTVTNANSIHGTYDIGTVVNLYGTLPAIYREQGWTITATNPVDNTWSFTKNLGPLITANGYSHEQSFARYFFNLTTSRNIRIDVTMRNVAALDILSQYDVGWTGVELIACTNATLNLAGRNLAYVLSVSESGTARTHGVYGTIRADSCGYGLSADQIDGGSVKVIARDVHRGAYITAPKNFDLTVDVADWFSAGVLLKPTSAPSLVGETNTISNVTLTAIASDFTASDPIGGNGRRCLVNCDYYTGTTSLVQNLTVNTKASLSTNTLQGVYAFYMDDSLAAQSTWNDFTLNVEHDMSQVQSTYHYAPITINHIWGGSGWNIRQQVAKLPFTPTYRSSIVTTHATDFTGNIVLHGVDPNLETITPAPYARLVGISTNGFLVGSGIALDYPGATSRNALGLGAVDLQFGRNAATKIASGTHSFLAGGTNNTASGTDSGVFVGSGNTASAISSGVIAGDSSTAAAYASAIVGGLGNQTVSGANYSVAMGQRASADLEAQVSHANGRFSATGDAQMIRLVCRSVLSTNQTLTTNLWVNGSSTRITLPGNTTWGFTAHVVGRSTDAGAADEETAYFIIKGCIERDPVGGTKLVGSTTVEVIARDDANWTADAVADATNNALQIDVTCDADGNSGTVYWFGVLYITNVGG